MRYERAEMEQAYTKLVQQEKPIFALLAAVIGLVPATLFLLLLVQHFILSLIVACFVFPAIAGLFARYVGRLYSSAARIPVMLVVGVAYIAVGLLLQAKVIWFLAGPIPFGVAFVTSKKSLTKLEWQAISEHSIKPFQLKEASSLRKAALPLLVLFSLPALSYLYFMLPNNACLKSIEQNNYLSVTEKCTLGKAGSIRNWLAGNDLASGHKFGTYYAPTKEAILIRTKAESGDIQFQILWWSIVDEAYRFGSDAEQLAGNDKYENDARFWRHNAALLGHRPAVEKELAIYSSLAQHLRAEAFKQQAIAFSKQLAAAKIDGADELLAAANHIVTQSDIVQRYRTQLADLGSLLFDELDNLLYAVESAEFHYNIHDFNERYANTGYYTGSIQVEIDEDKALEILKVMSIKFQNAEASYKVFKRLVRSNSKLAISFLEQAAKQGHIEAAAILGKILYCQNSRMEGLAWLKKAADLGSNVALEQQKEIGLTRNLKACS
ncbi:hypothetical protein SAMN05660691_01490 [Rheinheimera pacifica]|uniref:Sel1 repeat-containing protein n=2 Tax=Rheinheimera pacifica TaxID=173990 RepID=A0A1H6L117_9GAMM|nr:hypothetical protein SAMN05660691_01490 [Rheinheimera pacifica]